MSTSTPTPASGRRVLIIGWDAADWRLLGPLLDQGLLPALRRLVERGVMGNLSSLEPMLSPLLWTSIATGRQPDVHGILSFTEPNPLTGGVRPVTSTSRRVKALWNMASQSGLRSLVVGWFASHPAEPIRGAVVSDRFASVPDGPARPRPLPPGAVHPDRLARDLEGLRFQACEVPPGALLELIPRAAELDQKADPRLGLLARLLARTQSIHNAATWLLAHEPWDLACIYYDGIDHAGHHFMRYRAPVPEGVAARDVEVYGGVLDGVIRYHDLLLARLLELAGPETTVLLCSDHGFRPESARLRGASGVERAVAAHRRYGVLVLAGPGVREDERVYGASLLDVCPTALALLGLPAGRDMPGRVLVEAFAEPPALERIDSWESLAGDAGQHPQDAAEDPWEAEQALRQLVELGYVDAIGGSKEKQVRAAAEQRRYQLARTLLAQRRDADAATELQHLHDEQPADDRYAFLLAVCLRRLGRLDEAKALLPPVLERARDRPGADMVLGAIAFTEGREEDALAHLRRAEANAADSPGAAERIGRIYLQQRRAAEAERAFRAALAGEPQYARAHEGLAEALLWQSRWEEAVEAALDAVGLLHHLERAHFCLGLALVQLGRRERALQAFDAAAAIRPSWGEPRRLAAELRGSATAVGGAGATAPGVEVPAT